MIVQAIRFVAVFGILAMFFAIVCAPLQCFSCSGIYTRLFASLVLMSNIIAMVLYAAVVCERLQELTNITTAGAVEADLGYSFMLLPVAAFCNIVAIVGDIRST